LKHAEGEGDGVGIRLYVIGTKFSVEP